MTRWRRPRAARLAAAGLVSAGASLLLAGCSAPAPTEGAAGLLAEARTVIDYAPSAHVVLTSQGASGSGPLVVGAEGDLARPDSFRGRLSVVQGGLSLHLNVVAVNGSVYVQPPFSSTYGKVDPGQYGLGDPGRLISPGQGVSRLLTASTSARLGRGDRLDGEVLDEVDVSIPGSAVAGLLPDAAPTSAVHGVIGIDPSSHQVRRAVLSGPFYQAGRTSTFDVVIDRYGEPVSIAVPNG